MFKAKTPDPGVITFSTIAYRLLLRFYPTRFRREYGPHMAQVFRDCCLKAYRQLGLPGMLSLWAHTLFDWFKSVIEEQIHKETEMTRTKFIRLTGWSMILGALAMFVGFETGSAERIELSVIYRLVYNLFGPPSETSGINLYELAFGAENFVFLAVFGLLLVTIGLVGMHFQYGSQPKFPSLLISTVGGLSATVGSFLIWTYPDSEIGWGIFIGGLYVMFGFLVFFGLIALGEKPMGRGNWLPTVVGSLFFLQVADINFPYSDFILFLIVGIGLVFLGLILQTDASEKKLGTPVPI